MAGKKIGKNWLEYSCPGLYLQKASVYEALGVKLTPDIRLRVNTGQVCYFQIPSSESAARGF